MFSEFDALVVGGSFAGLSGAMQVARSGRPVCILDTRQPRNRFAPHSHGFFGQDGRPPLDMLTQAHADLIQYPNVTFLYTRATTATRTDTGFTITTDAGATLQAKKLLLAYGVTDVLPDLPGLQERWGITALHCPYCHGYEVKGQRLGVLSVGPFSTHQALLISDWGPVTFFLNGQPAPDPVTLAKLSQRGIPIETELVAALEGQPPALSGVRLLDGRLVPLDAVFLGSKLRFSSDLAQQLGCATEEGMQGLFLSTDASKQTSIPGVYAAGDIALRMANATLAAADGVLAGVSMHQSLIFEPLDALEPVSAS
ncbi:NAD(P)/FAD-dependent oxidoreductase [Deinococcus gobiensis]|uniref:FAD-dependent pyridine nucleotide-disulfide oxidoreductase n=1 Tax=Deinococcus gobiensis (strain DSM 21396 / JCM 16679 / CGMCC 1.7299 / I-0) TaxID=745776 RepID=H8H2W4_DEIGI|nr:NAD(P)/FAD-dependent oxidoreductase [Deinococcus gobiensis]AFD27861.1 FAD-dependent pyridine nucleotide-disulfide oxidoreductase [Deinococcus gobiensis I-0]